jgi:6-phosphofructokinase
MSDIHRQVVRRALLQVSHRVIDPEKARRGLLSFRSRKLETEKKKTYISKGGGLSVSIASKRKREWQGFGVVEEENNDDDCMKPSPLKRCTPPPPPKQLPPK